METKNFEYLSDQLRLTGFADVSTEQLKAEMEKKLPEFSIQHQIKYGDKVMDYKLNFSKSKTQDNYFLNNFDAMLEAPGKDAVLHTFYSDQRITAKEAFNLLEGRSVEKTYNHHEKIVKDGKEMYRPIKDDTYNQWRKLDFNDVDGKGNYNLKSYGEKWGFDLEQSLSALPIKQLNTPEDKTDLLNSLRKGNLQQVTFEQDGQKESRYVEANPRARTINVYDAQLNPILDRKLAKNITTREGESQAQTESTKSEQKKSDRTQKQGKGEENDPGAKKKNTKRKGMGI